LSFFCLSPSSSSFDLWHSRLGHVLSSRLRFLASTRALENLQTCDIFIVVNVNWWNFPLYLLIEVFLFLLSYLTWFILMYEDLFMLP
jgi:hypothetical protein